MVNQAEITELKELLVKCSYSLEQVIEKKRKIVLSSTLLRLAISTLQNSVDEFNQVVIGANDIIEH